MRKSLSYLIVVLSIQLLAQNPITFKWQKGSDTINQLGVYGTKGTAAITNIPGARSNSSSWTDASGNLWLFGGNGCSTSTLTGFLSDLWKYDISSNMWTWVAGTSTINSLGVYGTINVASSSNYPGGRQNAYTWTDSNGNLWLFGGQGYAIGGPLTYLNDLWKYNISSNQWTWVNGANSGTATSVYGTKGVSAPSNVPGGRFGGSYWSDNSNNLWLFGGQQNTGTVERVNDLWKYNISSGQWTWIGGSNTANQNGVYGTKGVASSSNTPGARQASVCWKENNNFWLFGGDGFAATGTTNNYMNDLWKYDVTNNMWTWMSGSNSYTQAGTYGTMGTSAPTNIPGARQMSIGWTDNANNLWMFGAWGYASPVFGRINDLWKYNTTSNEWIWMAGSSFTNQPGVYGTQGVASSTNIPGARRMSVAWKDNTGKFWLMGGSGIDKNNKTAYLNDLWQIDVGVTSGLNNFDEMSIGTDIYPNPAIDKIFINTEKDLNKYILIYDSNGKVVLKQQILQNKTEIKVENLPNGVYLISVDNTFGKFIKIN